jgi:hypothetical protein
LSKDLAVRKENYENHYSHMDNRNSYSKTDPDATFMRMKEDHMQNGQLKPGYNVQVGTENGFVTTFGTYSNPTDTRTLIPQLEKYNQQYGHYPEKVVADKGYGSLENYAELEKKKIEAYIKYPHWELEKKKRSKKYKYRSWKFEYDKTKDELICPEKKVLSFIYEKERTKWDGKKETFGVYQCDSCKQCPVRELCTTREFRRVEFNKERWRLYNKARERLKTDDGWQLYRKRAPEVETVFGEVKGNRGFRRFQGFGKQNVTCDWAIHMIAYNIKNICRSIMSSA